eukprot:Seg1452.6 transcript_id=Seg1452.6/GoldUCD/mRNA.D3Y31 product="hypothetical protein" protein_id=Seg1452.6/GoldUCD/D3Y31
MFVESSIRGYHAYKEEEVFVGEMMICEPEEDNGYDEYAVSVQKENGKMVGHVPIELSIVFCNFLKDYGEVEAECIGSRYNAGAGKGLELPVDYKLIGTYNYLIRVEKEIEVYSSSSIKCTGVEPSNSSLDL